MAGKSFLLADSWPANTCIIISSLVFLLLSWIIYGYVVSSAAHCDIDSTGYDRIACHFNMTNSLLDPLYPIKAPVQPVGYSFLLGFIYKIFGYQYAAVVWVQVFLMLFSGLLLFSLIKRIHGLSVACVASCLFLTCLGSLTYSQFLLAETLWLFFFMLFLHQFMRFIGNDKIINLIIAAFTAGISLLVKPVLLILGFLIPVFIFFVPKQSCVGIKRRIILSSLFLVVFSLPLISYMVRNYNLYNYFRFAPMMSLNMYHVFLSKVIARVEGISVMQAEGRIPPFNAPNTLDEDGWQGARNLFNHYIMTYPWDSIVVWFTNVAKTYFGLYTTQLKMLFNPAIKGTRVSFFDHTGTLGQRFYAYLADGSSSGVIFFLSLYEACWSVVRYLLAIFGVLLLFYYQQYWLALFMVVVILYGGLITGFDGCGRYRIVFEPLLLWLAALSLVFLCNYDKKNLNNNVLIEG